MGTDGSISADHRWMPPLIPPEKVSVHLRLDKDVYDWFKEQGRGHLTRMNAVLKSYMYTTLNARLKRLQIPKKKKRKQNRSA